MERRLIMLAALMFVLGNAQAAEPSTHVAWTPETLALVKNANAQHGQELAKTLGCDGCHSGTAMPEAPQLNGQLATYLYRQMRDYQDHSRANDIMASLVQGMSQQDVADLAAWYGKQEPAAATAAKADNEAAERLAKQGDNQRMLPSCAACHGNDGQGQPQDVPRLAGQKPAYLAATLQAYRSGQRHNDIYGRMRAVAKSLSEQEVRALADYYAAQR